MERFAEPHSAQEVLSGPRICFRANSDSNSKPKKTPRVVWFKSKRRCWGGKRY